MLLLVLALMLTSCGRTPTNSAETTEANMTLSLSSTAFAAGQPIPAPYSCKGGDVSPPLAWNNSPAGTKSFALIVDDPDAPMGTWVHWVLFNVPAATNSLPEAIPAGTQLADGSAQGRNSSGNSGYNGPCPPSGTHRYFFKLYALDATLTLPSGADKGRLLEAMQGHILAQGELMGTFTK
jgi:Raf kinase inhibitor-like YbhB/YbcL family protein